MKFTDKALVAAQKAMRTAGQSRRLLYCETVPGFGANLTASGVSFFFEYRNAERQQRRTKIGRHGDGEGELTASAARKIASAWKVKVQAGQGIALTAGQKAVASPDRVTVGTAIEAWLTRGAKKWRPATYQDYRWALDLDVL